MKRYGIPARRVARGAPSSGRGVKQPKYPFFTNFLAKFRGNNYGVQPVRCLRGVLSCARRAAGRAPVGPPVGQPVGQILG